jgi:hypothetical protein
MVISKTRGSGFLVSRIKKSEKSSEKNYLADREIHPTTILEGDIMYDNEWGYVEA